MAKNTSILPQVLQELDKDSLIGIIIKEGERIEELTKQQEELLRQNAELEKAGKRQAAPFVLKTKSVSKRNVNRGLKKVIRATIGKQAGRLMSERKSLCQDVPSAGMRSLM